MIEQIIFDIPVDIRKRLCAGELNRFGGVVRNNMGHIVKHLEEVKLLEPTTGAMETVINVIKKPTTIMLIGIGMVALGTVGVISYFVNKKKKKVVNIVEMPECVNNYNIMLSTYLEAVQNSKLDLVTINALISALEDIKENIDKKKISITLSTEQLYTLSSLVFDYTKKLANVNSIDFNEKKMRKTSSADNAILGLRKYLVVQKSFFEHVA